MSLVHRTCFDVYQRRPFFSIAIKPIERIIIPAFELIYMYFISRIWKNKSVNFRMCMSQKKWKRKFGFSFPMSIKKTFEIYDDCLFLIMLACPNEQFIKYIVGFSCILVFFFMNLHCILISHHNNIYHPMSMDINSKLRAV